VKNTLGLGSSVVQESSSDCYLVDAVLRACDLLEAFHTEGELLRLCDLTARIGSTPATTFRILRTLESRGLIQRVDGKRYRSNCKLLRKRKYRIGYATQSNEFAFTREVTESLVRAAQAAAIDLVVLNNRYSAKTALRNAERLVAEKVDLAVEFQTDEHVSPAISSIFANAQIPLIALEIPHPGAVYFGADNYNAGRIGGRALAKWARAHWQGKVEEILLLELPMAGALPGARLAGTLAGIHEVLPRTQSCPVVRQNGNGQFERSLSACRKHLSRSRARNTLVGAINDPSALGALRAFAEAGRTEYCAVMGQNASIEARAELRRSETRLIGSVGYFPEKYGQAVIRLAVDILEKKYCPPAIFIHHRLVTRATVDHYYPQDLVQGLEDPEALLFRAR
jgi:ribose transport system substrate-binding protein